MRNSRQDYEGELESLLGMVEKILEKDKLTPETANAPQIAEAENTVKNEFQATLLINFRRYKQLKDALETKYTTSRDAYQRLLNR